MMRGSLSLRLLLIASLLLLGALGLAGLVLGHAWEQEKSRAQAERLRLLAYTLVAAIEPDGADGVRLAHPLSELRLFLPGSGIYASVRRNDGRAGWDSPSLAGAAVPLPRGLVRLEERLDRLQTEEGPVRAFSIGMTWTAENDPARIYTVGVAEGLEAHQRELAAFRRILWGWLGALALVLLTAQWVVLRQGLAPLRRTAADLGRIERGERDQLTGRYPAELRGLVRGLNALVREERQRRERYRNALADLAHSLRTPLAVLRSDLEGGAGGQAVHAQIDRMSQIVDYQLRRAGTQGRSALGPPVDAVPIGRKMLDALAKVHQGRGLELSLGGDASVPFRGDPDDLMEILGNLLDNACKWARQRVCLVLRRVDRGEGPSLELLVEDDGPGIPELISAGPARGQRGSDGVPGHGIGLAMVRDIVAVYEGELQIGRSLLGGARVRVVL